MAKKEKWWSAGIGVGIFGMILLALKYAVRPATKSRLPDAISPAIFATKAQSTSAGMMVYHESGRGRPLIFLHHICLGASSYEWSKIYPQFADAFRVLAPDWIGFGESARPDAKFAVSDYAESLAEFIRATCGDEPPIIVASGFGAGLAVFLANRHPKLVARLILLMPTGRRDGGQQRLSLTTKCVSRVPLLGRFLYRNYQSTQTGVQTWLQRVAFFDAARVSDETLSVFATCAQQSGAEYALLNFYAGALNFDLEKEWKRVAQPLTVIWSESVAFPSMQAAARLQKIAPQNRLIPFSGSGMLAALETPEKLTEILRESLTAVSCN